MNAESESISHESFNTREAAQMNNGEALHNVNLPEAATCILCRRIFSPYNEVNRLENVNMCRGCEVMFYEYSEAIIRDSRRRRPIRRGRRLRNSRSLESIETLFSEQISNLRQNQNIVPIPTPEQEPQLVEGDNAARVLQRTSSRNTPSGSRRWRNLEETQRNLEEVQRDLEEAQRDFEETRRNLEENWRNLEETQRGLEETRQRLEPHRQRVKQRIESLPRVIITEEHEKKHNGLVCAICLDPLSVGSIVKQLPCFHFFHPLCIVPWLNVRMSCPTCRYKLSSAFRIATRQNSNIRIRFREIVHEGSSVSSSFATSEVNEPEVVVSESYNETTDSSLRDREGRRGGWFLFAAAPVFSLVVVVGIALVECFQNLPGDGRGRGSTGQQQVRLFSSGSSSTRTSNSRENT